MFDDLIRERIEKDIEGTGGVEIEVTYDRRER